MRAHWNQSDTNLEEFIKYCSHLSPLTNDAAEELFPCLKTKVTKKGDHVVNSGQTCRHLYFINSGLVKTCFDKDGKEFIMRFFPENFMLTILDSFLTLSPSNYRMVALENSSFTMLSKDDLDKLSAKHHCIETFFRKLVSFATLNMMSRISEMLEENAEEGYKNFIEKNPTIFQRISLGDLASYLGITQVTLSRIRAKK